MNTSFQQSLTRQARLGVGVSGEFGVRPSLDPIEFDRQQPGLIHFYEFGTDADRGLDDKALRWVDAGRPATYHFLDLNLEEPEELDEHWLQRTTELATTLRSPWICGDAGLWHFGPRDRGHGLLLPPILEPDSAREMARNIRRLQQATGFMVLPENPPSLYFLGRLHILEYFAMVCQEADCGMLLDAAHLAIFQVNSKLPTLTAIDDFPLDRIVEIHAAGGGEKTTSNGYQYLDDDHRATIQQQVWTILHELIPRCPNLKALCYECEHNPPDETIETFQKLNAMFPAQAAPDTPHNSKP